MLFQKGEFRLQVGNKILKILISFFQKFPAKTVSAFIFDHFTTLLVEEFFETGLDFFELGFFHTFSDLLFDIFDFHLYVQNMFIYVISDCRLIYTLLHLIYKYFGHLLCLVNFS